jgi:O-antigen ligase
MKNWIHIFFISVALYLIFVASENIYLPFSPGQIVVSTPFLLVFFLIACWIQSLKAEASLFRLPGGVLLGFFLWAIWGQNFSIDSELSYYGFLKYLSVAIFIIAASLYCRNEKNISIVLWTLLISSIIHSLIVVGQHYSFSWVHLKEPLWGNATTFQNTHGVEARKWGNPSTFSNINYFGGYLVLQLPIAALLFFKKQKPWEKYLSALAFSLIIISLVYSRSFSGQVVAALEMILILLVYLGWTAKTRKIAIAGGFIIGVFSIILMVAASFQGDYEDLKLEDSLIPVKLSRAILGGNLLNRIVYWRGAWEIAKEKPLTGTGSLTFGALYPYFISKVENNLRPGYIQKSPPHAHSLYFQILSDHGWIGLIIFTGFLFVWFKRIYKIIQTKGNSHFKNEALVIAIACFGFLTQNLIEVNWLVSSFIFHFALLIVVFDFYYSQIFQKNKITSNKIYFGLSIILCLMAIFSAYFFRQYNQILKVEILESQRAESFIKSAEKAEKFCSSCASAKVVFAKTLLEEYKINQNPNFLIEAEKKLEVAVLDNPYNVPVLIYLGNIYAMQGKEEEALQKLSLALKLYPNSPEAKDGFSKLTSGSFAPDSSQAVQ